MTNLCRFRDPLSSLGASFARVLNSCWHPDPEAMERRGVIHLNNLGQAIVWKQPSSTYPISTHELFDTRDVVANQFKHGLVLR